MKLAPLLIVFFLNSALAQDQSQLRCLSKIDSIVGEFYSNFSDSNVCALNVKRNVLHNLNQYLLSKNKIVFDSVDFTAFGFFTPQFDNCEVNVLIFLTGFDSYLLTTDLGLKIIDAEKIGENTPTLWNARTGTGRYQRAKSRIENCRLIKTISTNFEVKDRKKKIVISETVTTFEINAFGKINIR